jgi:hypothetical protein
LFVGEERTFLEERRFGLAVGGLLALIGGLLVFWRHRTTAGVAFLVPGGVLLLLAFVAPVLLVLPRSHWMRFAHLLGRVNTAVLLFLVFYFVLTPLGFVLRLFGRDELRRRRAPGDSMWVPYPERNRDVGHFEKMF